MPGGRGGDGVQHPRRPQAHGLALQQGIGHRPRVVGADGPDHVGGGQRPVDESLFLDQLGGVGGLAVVLRLRRQGFTVFQRVHHVQQGVTAEQRQPVVQAGRGVVTGNGTGEFVQHVAGIKSGVHLHDGDAGFPVAGENGALDGRGSSPARQQRTVHVDATETGNVQHRLRQDQAVSGHHHQVGLQRRQLGLGAGVAQGQGLVHRQLAVQGQRFDRPRLELAAAPRGPVGLGINRDHVMAVLQQGAQGFRGENRRTGEDNP